jgi:predicted nucleotidyltransferase
MDPRLQIILAELRRSLDAIYGERLSRLILFGSHARGDAEPGSDIDVLVVLRGPVNAGEEVARTGGIVAELCLRHTEVVNCVFMEEDRFAKRQGPLLRNIRKEGIPI